MYNTVFWALVLQGGRTEQQAEQELRVRRLMAPLLCSPAHAHCLPRAQGTISSQKQEILFSQFGINYNTVDAMFRKGSIVIWEEVPPTETQEPVRRARFSAPVTATHTVDTRRDTKSSLSRLNPHRHLLNPLLPPTCPRPPPPCASARSRPNRSAASSSCTRT